MAKKPTKQKASTEAPQTKGAAKKSAPKRSPKTSTGKQATSAKATKPAPKAPAAKSSPKPTKGPAKARPEPKAEPKVDSKASAKSGTKAVVEAKKRPAPPPAPKAGAKGAAQPEAGKPEAGGKSGRKGITIVTPKPAKKPRPKSAAGTVPALSGSILGMGLGTGRPLIPSGPAFGPGSGADGVDSASTKKPKSPYTKRQLDKFQEILLAKRRELLGDIDSMEKEALKSQSGSLSHLPQHMAEQGSETYEQSLSLDLAAADRTLLREIDGALQRIADRTYGLCERTGKPITKERLAELPWARYSIEAAREMERRTT